MGNLESVRETGLEKRLSEKLDQKQDKVPNEPYPSWMGFPLNISQNLPQGWGTAYVWGSCQTPEHHVCNSTVHQRACCDSIHLRVMLDKFPLFLTNTSNLCPRLTQARNGTHISMSLKAPQALDKWLFDSKVLFFSPHRKYSPMPPLPSLQTGKYSLQALLSQKLYVYQKSIFCFLLSRNTPSNMLQSLQLIYLPYPVFSSISYHWFLKVSYCQYFLLPDGQ